MPRLRVPALAVLACGLCACAAAEPPPPPPPPSITGGDDGGCAPK